MGKGLTDKQEKFVQGLLKGLSQRQAYKESFSCNNWKPESIDSKASKLLATDKVRSRYDELRDKVIQKVEEEGLFNATDVLKKIHDIVVENEKEDPKTALKGLELYGKHLKLFTDKVEHSGKIDATVVIEISEDDD